jgi:23S rRNA pseudouridine1911/1915/1917 synthase
MKWILRITEPTLPFIKSRADKTLIHLYESNEGSLQNDPQEIKEEDEGEELKPILTRSFLEKLIDMQKVLLNGKPLKPSALLKLNDQIEILFPEPEPLEVVAEDIPLHILYEDNDLIIVNKPQGLTVHPSSTQHSHTLVNALLYHIKDLSALGGVLRPGIVHRIDKNTSGALCVTKTDRAHLKLSEAFKEHKIHRIYWALCYGVPEWNQKTLESLIARNPNDRLRMSCEVKEGKKAVSHFKVLKRFGNYASLIEAKLETGRTHQIRVHLTHLGHSIIGDLEYGKPSAQHDKLKRIPPHARSLIAQLKGQMLHAKELGFDHPTQAKFLKVEAPFEADWNNLMQKLESS